MHSLSLKKTRLYLSAFFNTDAGKSLLIVFTWQAAITVIGYLFDTSLSNIFQSTIRPDGHISLLSHTSNWDSNWYGTITQDAYRTNLASSVFYPLYPLLVWTVQTLSFDTIGTLFAGQIINTVALFFAILALVKIGDFFVAKNYRWYIVVAFICSPAAIFLHFFYTEAIFCAIGFWAYLFALKREWWKMAILLSILSAVRLPAILFIGLCGLEYLRSYSWRIRSVFNKNILWFLVTPLGFVFYGLYLYSVRSDFFGMFHGYKLTHDWDYQVFNPNILETLGKVANTIWTAARTSVPFDEGVVVNNLFPFMAVGALFIAAVYCFTRLRKEGGIPLGLFSLAAIIMFCTNSNVVSVHRYALPILALYIVLVHFCWSGAKWRKYVFYTYIYCSIILQTYLLILFTNSYFSG